MCHWENAGELESDFMTRRRRKLVLVMLLALHILVPAAVQSEDIYESDEREDGWLDQSHSYLTKKADSLAVWADAFFGEPRDDLESPSSRLRLRFEPGWDELDHWQFDARVRGKLYLPALNKRLSLVFEGADDAQGEGFESAALATDDGDSVSLQYNVSDDARSRLDFNLGVKSGPKLKTGVRYRYRRPIADNTLLRFTEELFWVGGDGFGTLSRLDFDHRLGEGQLVRWSNRALYSEDSDGLEWGIRLSLRQRLNQRTAMRYFVATRGETEPKHLNRGYGLGVAWRRQMFREWLFVEVEPSYFWERKRIDVEREGVFALLLRLEVVIDDSFAAKKE